MTPDQLRKSMPFAGRRADVFAEPLTQAMDEFGINTDARRAAFIAQIGHESGCLRYVRELASGAAYDTGRLASRLGNTPEADGDGQRYKGRGLIQITGRANYRACSLALFGDERLLDRPEVLEETVPACRSAAWFWASRDLNELADRGEFELITRRINGGLNGLKDRLDLWALAKHALRAA